MNRPNFLILGAAKSGTTSLYAYLGEHPDVFFSEPKEPIFFEAEWERGLDYYWSRYFIGYRGQRAVGEARVYNLYLPYVVPRIHESLPDARLIAILRNPVERAYSHWWHRVSQGQERLPFEDALEENRRRLEAGIRFEGEEGARLWRKALHRTGTATDHRTYLDLGYYAEQLRRYAERFSASQLRVVLYDDLAREPAALTRDLWEYLGVDSDFELSDPSARNVAREEIVHPLGMRVSRWHQQIRVTSFLPTALKRRVRGLFVRPAGRRPEMAAATRRDLIEHFAPHNAELARFLRRDLVAWSGVSAGEDGSQVPPSATAAR